MIQDRAEEIVSKLGIYSQVEELMPCPYIITPWGGKFEKEVEYQVNIYQNYADITFFQGMRCFRFKDFFHLRRKKGK